MPSSSITQNSKHEIMSTVEKSHPDIMKSANCFVLKSSSDFATRSTCVFNKLNTLEVNHNVWISRNQTHDAFDENGTESKNRVSSAFKKPVSPEFKKPFAPKPLKKRRTVFPYDRKNGRKWIKYSLADIPLSSDATNSAVAFEFLSSLRNRKESESPTMNDDDTIVFCKPKGKPSKNRSSSIPESSEDVDGMNMNERINISNIKLTHLDEF